MLGLSEVNKKATSLLKVVEDDFDNQYYETKRKVTKNKFRTEFDEEVFNIVILNAEDHCFGIVVDQILDTEEIVVKPLSNSLKALSLFGGATIMGDGKVALILD